MKFFKKNSKNLFENFVPGKMRFENFSEKLFFSEFFCQNLFGFFSKQKFSVKKFPVKILRIIFVLIAVEVGR